MKKFQEPPFKQNAIALGFTLGVHAIAIVGLLFLGLSKPPEQPKKLTTVLIKPEDLPPPMAKPVEQETTAENQAEEILSPIVDNTQPENLPITPPTPTAQQLADAKQKTEQQAKLAEKKRYLQESIVLISRAMQEQQCEFSEGALRLWVLLDHWPADDKPDAIQSYPGLYQMYQVVKDMPTHQARKEQDKKLTRQQDKLRQQAEIDLRELIQADVGKLLQRFQQA